MIKDLEKQPERMRMANSNHIQSRVVSEIIVISIEGRFEAGATG